MLGAWHFVSDKSRTDATAGSPEHGLAQTVKFHRDKQSCNPRRRARRQVEELRPELIGRLFAAAHISLRAQLAVEWPTDARVSSVLYGVRVCDVILAKGHETIIFHGTKNGDDIVAALHPTAADILLETANGEAAFTIVRRRSS